MRILYFHQHFSTPAGSTGTRSYEMARRLIARGHQVTMVCGSYKGAVTGLDGPFTRSMRRGQVDGIDIIQMDCAYSNAQGFFKRSCVFMSFAMRGIRLALTETYDLVFATSTPLTAGIPGIVARWVRGKRFVFEVRDLWPELPRAMGVIKNPLVLIAMEVLEYVSYHAADKLIALSPGIMDGIAKRRISRNRIAMIPNGCDMELFDTAGTDWRPEGIAADALLAVYAGTHGIANGLHAALDAAAILKARGREDICILLIGEGKLKPELMQRAEREGLTTMVFHAPVSKTKLAGLMKRTDVGLQLLANVPAFYYGTSPNKFFDYLSAKVPVLTNYPGWVAELIAANECGLRVKPDNAESFANALEHAADHRAELKQMGECAQELAKREFDRAVLSEQFVDWLTTP